jgi:hypothetical protein
VRVSGCSVSRSFATALRSVTSEHAGQPTAPSSKTPSCRPNYLPVLRFAQTCLGSDKRRCPLRRAGPRRPIGLSRCPRPDCERVVASSDIDLRLTIKKPSCQLRPNRLIRFVSNAPSSHGRGTRSESIIWLERRCAAQAANSRMPGLRNHKTRLSCAFQLSGGFPVLVRSLMSSAIWAAICVTFVSRSSPSITNRAAPIYGSNDSAAPGFLLL